MGETMDKKIYSSTNDEGLLRYLGPYRIFSSSSSLELSTDLNVYNVTMPQILITSQTYGQTILFTSEDVGIEILPPSYTFL